MGDTPVQMCFPNGTSSALTCTQKLAGSTSRNAAIVFSGVDALASFLPLGFQDYKLWAEAFFIAVLIVMNLRGLKEAIQILLPIFLGFVATHLVLIVYGIVAVVLAAYAVYIARAASRARERLNAGSR